MASQLNGCPHFFVFLFHSFFLELIVTQRLWVIYMREITIPMCRLLLHSLSITWTSLHISETTGWVYSIQSSVDFCTPVVAQYHGNLPDRDCPWAKNLSNMVPVGSRLCISLKPLDGFYLCPWAKSFSSEITFIGSSWLVVVQHQGHFPPMGMPMAKTLSLQMLNGFSSKFCEIVEICSLVSLGLGYLPIHPHEQENFISTNIRWIFSIWSSVE